MYQHPGRLWRNYFNADCPIWEEDKIVFSKTQETASSHAMTRKPGTNLIVSTSSKVLRMLGGSTKLRFALVVHFNTDSIGMVLFNSLRFCDVNVRTA